MSQQSDNRSMPVEQQPLNIENRNFLSPVGFQFLLNKVPGSAFFCQSASIPAISMGVADQVTRLNKVYQPGDELYYEPLYIRFLIDENMKNYYQIHDWIRRITTPYASQEFTYNTLDDGADDRVPYEPRDRKGNPIFGRNQWKSDASLLVLSSNYQPVAEFTFQDCFPISLTTLNFDASVQDISYFTAEAVFRYNYFNYRIWDAAHATDASMEQTYRKTYRQRSLDNLQN